MSLCKCYLSCNWSCWIELAKVTLKQMHDPPIWPPKLACAYLKTCTYSESEIEIRSVMFNFFLAYFFIEKQNGEQAMQALEPLIPWFPKSQHIAAQVNI